jgi:hypothetical protein
MALGAIGEMLDQRRPPPAPRAVAAQRRGIDRQRVVAVDAQPRHAIADRARGEGGALRPGEARKLEIAHWLLTMLRMTGAL